MNRMKCKMNVKPIKSLKIYSSFLSDKFLNSQDQIDHFGGEVVAPKLIM